MTLRTMIDSSPLGALRCLPRSDVGDGDAAAAGGGRGQDPPVLLDVDEGRASGGHRAARGARRRARELHGAEVGEGHERVALLKVLDDPLGVLLAELRARGERLAHGLAARHVLDHSGAGRRRGRGDGELDLVAGADGDAREVGGEVGEVLVPGCREGAVSIKIGT